MPASRIAFAIGDLMDEIRRLMPQDAEIVAELRLDPNAYKRVTAELAHHFGKELTRTPIVQAGGGGEFVKIGGLRISTMLSEPKSE